VPDDHEVPGGVGGDCRIEVKPRGVGVDAELRAQRDTRAREPLAGDVVSGVAADVVLPDHDEVAGRIRSHHWITLIGRRVRVDAELRAERGAGCGEALAEDTVTRAVLTEASPYHDEVPRRVRRHGRTGLRVRDVGVHAELGAEGIAGAGVA